MPKVNSLALSFEDNQLLPLLFGEQDQHLLRIESALDVVLNVRGNQIVIQGNGYQIELAQTVLLSLYGMLEKNKTVSLADVDQALNLKNGPAPSAAHPPLEVMIPARGRLITPRTPGQSQYMKTIQDHDLTFGIGPAGTGKTYLAVACAVSALLTGQVSRIILSRPAVEAGERLGFLPGDLRDKVDPYLRPLFDALYDMLPSEQVIKRMSNSEIEIAPLAFMRGRTLSRAFVILDEAQNATVTQMKMFLTRLGEGSKMVVTGDITQVDLPLGTPSGLAHAVSILKEVSDVGIHQFSEQDIVRHNLVARIVKAYDDHSRRS